MREKEQLESKKGGREEGSAESSTAGERWAGLKADGGWLGVDWEREGRCQDAVEIEVGIGLTVSTHRCRGVFRVLCL